MHVAARSELRCAKVFNRTPFKANQEQNKNIFTNKESLQFRCLFSFLCHPVLKTPAGAASNLISLAAAMLVAASSSSMSSSVFFLKGSSQRSCFLLKLKRTLLGYMQRSTGNDSDWSISTRIRNTSDLKSQRSSSVAREKTLFEEKAVLLKCAFSRSLLRMKDHVWIRH